MNIKSKNLPLFNSEKIDTKTKTEKIDTKAKANKLLHFCT